MTPDQVAALPVRDQHRLPLIADLVSELRGRDRPTPPGSPERDW